MSCSLTQLWSQFQWGLNPRPVDSETETVHNGAVKNLGLTVTVLPRWVTDWYFIFRTSQCLHYVFVITI